MQFNEKLAALRKSRGLTQEALAEALGISRQAVSRWEAGETTPELSLLRKLCRIFDTSADYLINDDVTRPDDTPALRTKNEELVLIKSSTHTLALISAMCFVLGWAFCFIGIFFAMSPLQLALSIIGTIIMASAATYQFIKVAKMR